MSNKLNIQPLPVPDIPFVPKQVTNAAMIAYVVALLLCLLVYQQYALELRWMLFGLVEVCGFFFMSNQLSKSWVRSAPRTFARNLFWWGFALRAVWVVLSFFLYIEWTGQPFSIGAGDELFYDDVAHYGASLMREGNWHIYSGIEKYAGNVHYSDMGYPLYLTIIYWIFGDSIFMARIIKALLGGWTAVLIYKLAARNFGEHTGRMAGIMCMLMPNLIYYCSMQLKEVEMVFLAMLFAERADLLLRQKKLPWKALITLMLIPLYMFMIRTVLAATLVLAFLCALLLSSQRVINSGRRTILIVVASIAALVMITTSTNIVSDVRQMWEIGSSTQEAHAEWRSKRVDQGGFKQSFAKYAGSAVFAPMIFTIPFPTMAETPGQENQKLIHGGNYVKNILSFFTITTLLLLLASGEWRKYVLPLAILCGYLVVLVFSNFAHSERFHLPILPLHLMMAAYGISKMRQLKLLKNSYPYWCILMIIAALAWNWFKLSGRGMI